MVPLLALSVVPRCRVRLARLRLGVVVARLPVAALSRWVATTSPVSASPAASLVPSDRSPEGAAGAANAFAPAPVVRVCCRGFGYPGGEPGCRVCGALAGIGAEGLLETFSLNDSALSDPSKSLPGR